MAYGTLILILTLAAALHLLRVARRQKSRFRVEAIAWPVTVASLSILTLEACASLRQPAFVLPAAATGITVLSLSATFDLLCRHYFAASPLKVYRHLPVSGFGAGTRSMARAYIAQLLPVGFLASLAAMLGIVFAVIEWTGAGGMPSMLTALGVCLLSLGIWSLLDRLRSPGLFSPIEQTFLRIEPTMRATPLRAADRSGHFSLTGEPPARPRTILLIVNESTSHDLPSSADPDLRLHEKLRELSGTPEEWFVPSNAVTNSSCTDVSLPSLLTGTGSHESADKLHRMPFLFDFARAQGYRTAFVTSTTLDWAYFDRFFAGAKIDELFCADTTESPIVNDISIDDAEPIMRLAYLIEEAQEPLFAVLYTNALHVPFQSESRIPIPPALKDRRSRALHIVEAGHKHIFDALRRSGRYDDALILSVADHGERLEDPLSHKWIVPRLENYSEPILRPLFMLKPPRDLPPAMLRALHRNADALIANIDIAPTLAHLLGVSLGEDLAYAGHSLFEEIPADRLAIATSTNAWRSWHRTGVALMRGRERLVCDSYGLCEYYRIDDIAESPGDASARERRDSMMMEAFGIPTLRENIARIYRKRI
ncbi:sulfatase-like hydrolase/transferase [Parvibaculum sp.]|uniref:sulfatase-like hydrolase/transferase n=1 Tax=Parvibaculum sp. TaxID=2024848 RepID=UPI00320F339A